MEIENFERRLVNFKSFPKDSNLSVLLLMKYGFDFNEKKVICTKCDYSNSNYLYVTLQVLIRDHLIGNKNCSNCNIQIDLINYIDSNDNIVHTNSIRKQMNKLECEKTFEGVSFTELLIGELVENGFFMTDNSNPNIIKL